MYDDKNKLEGKTIRKVTNLKGLTVIVLEDGTVFCPGSSYNQLRSMYTNKDLADLEIITEEEADRLERSDHMQMVASLVGQTKTQIKECKVKINSYKNNLKLYDRKLEHLEDLVRLLNDYSVEIDFKNLSMEIRKLMKENI